LRLPRQFEIEEVRKELTWCRRHEAQEGDLGELDGRRRISGLGALDLPVLESRMEAEMETGVGLEPIDEEDEDDDHWWTQKRWVSGC